MANVTERRINRKYHKVYLPLLDIYDDGGPEVFSSMERKKEGNRNLIVITSDIIDGLSELATQNSYGAMHALSFIREHLSRKVDSFQGASLYEFSKDLDVCLISDSHVSTAMIDNLEKRVSGLLDQPDRRLMVITDNDKKFINLTDAGFCVEAPRFLIVNEDIVKKGIKTGNNELLSALYSSPTRSVPIAQAKDILDDDNLFMNQFIKFRSEGTEVYAIVKGEIHRNQSGSRIVDVSNVILQLLPETDSNRKLHIGYKGGDHFTTDDFIGVKPLDNEQFLALQYGLIPRDISIFFLCGGQGSGKTLLAFVSALDSVLWYPQEKRIQRGLTEIKGAFFEQVIYMKPPETLGGSRRKVGFLPGNLYEKLEPNLKPLRNAYSKTALSDCEIPFEELLRHPKFESEHGSKRKDKLNYKGAYFPPRNPAIEIVDSGFIGGSSIANTRVFIDEAQDYTPYEMKTILERLALGSSAIITGDPVQTRNPHCSPKKNGLTFALQNFIGQPYAGLIWLTRNYRNEVSEQARNMRAYNTSTR